MLVVRVLDFHAEGLGFDPWSGHLEFIFERDLFNTYVSLTNKEYKWMPTLVGEINLQYDGILFRGSPNTQSLVGHRNWK